MLGAVLRNPASSIPPLFPAPACPLIHLSRRLPAVPTMTDAKKTDAPTAPAPAPAPAPEPPEKPLPGDCYGSGCVRCVWDIYYDEVQDYQKALSAHSATADPNGDKASADENKTKS